MPTDPVGLTDNGLTAGAGSTLVRMRQGVSGRPELALDDDSDRMVALVSVMANAPVAAADLLPHVKAAAAHWRNGDKALANIRLAFAKLPQVADQATSCRLALAEHLLDNGWTPRGLMIELGLAAPTPEVAKYNSYHVPAGNGRRSGQFDFGPGSIVVAGGEDEKMFEERELLGETSPKEELEHGHPITPTTGMPFIDGRGPAAVDAATLRTLSDTARAAADKVGPGKGPVYGTNVHTEFKAQVKALNRDDLHTEQSYLNGRLVKYGTPGSVRVDVGGPTPEKPYTVYDLKTGGASLTAARERQLRTHLPKLDNGQDVQIHEIRP